MIRYLEALSRVRQIFVLLAAIAVQFLIAPAAEAQVATVTVSPANVAEDGTPNLVFTVSLDQPQATDVTVDLSVSGTADSTTDYTGISAGATTVNVLVVAGDTEGTVMIDPATDTDVEADETVTFSIQPSANYTIGASASATGTILNDDQPTLSINDVTVSEGDSGTTNATFTVSLSQPAGPGGVTFDIGTAAGSATAGSDFVTQTLTGETIAGGSSTYSFTVAVNGDTTFEPDETFFVNVTGVSGATVADGQGLGTITNDDANPPTATIAVSPATVLEDGGAALVYTVTLSSAPAPSTFVAVDLAESGTATAGADFTGGASNLVFNAGETTKTFNVTPLSDPIVEGDETVIYTVVAGTGYTVGAPGSATGTIANDDVAITIAPGTLPGGTVGAAYSQTITGSGGTAPYSFQVTAGSLPNGLTLATGGALSGTPTAAGSFNFTVTATDSSGAPGPYTATQAYNVTIAAPTLTMTPGAGTLTATYNTAYSQAFTASGGTGSYSYAITGTLPAGLSFGGNTISGTPTAPGSYPISITATDTAATGAGAPFSVTQSYTLNVPAPTITVSPATLPGATVGAAYSQTLSASGGAGSYSFAITGTLPAGISLTGSALSGTPTQAGSFNVTVTATDANGQTGSSAYTLNVAAPTLAITPASGALPITYATPFNRSFAASGGIGPYTYALSGTLPAGLSFTAATATVPSRARSSRRRWRRT